MAAAQAKNSRPFGDGQPKAAVPTQSSDQLFPKWFCAHEWLWAGTNGFGYGTASAVPLR
jgi:hypothetical protein